MATSVDSASLSSASPSTPATTGKAMLWAGRVVTALAALVFVSSGIMKLSSPPDMVKQFTEDYGFPANTLVPIGIVELVCVALYVVPRTTVLGAVLLTAYLGGAVVTHVRISDAFIAPIIIGVLVWAGPFLRDARVRALLPLRRGA